MFNSNLHGNGPIINTDINKKELFASLTSDEKAELISSLQILGINFENFIISFYQHYLEEKTLKFVQNSSKESLINMLSASLNLIISSIEQPIPLEDYIDILITKHPNFPIMIKNKDLFVKAFMKAIIDSFKGDYNERLGLLWHKSVSNFTYSISFLIN